VQAASEFRSSAFVAGYFALWAATFVFLKSRSSFGVEEALAAFVILGLIFPALALLTTRRATPLSHSVRRPGFETAILIACLVAITIIVVCGFAGAVRITTEPLHSVVLLGAKLIIFVVFPATVLVALGRYRLSELIPTSFRWASLRPAMWMALAGLLMESVLGRGLRDIHSARPPAGALALAVPLCFAWLAVEVGVVEEFFFRALLQERLAAWLRSSWGGLIIAALLFGLMHAPGFYLRPAATQEMRGAHPSLLLAIGYSIIVTSTAGLFLGVLWMRTKNFAVVVIVHAACDLLPGVLPWARAFHLVQ